MILIITMQKLQLAATIVTDMNFEVKLKHLIDVFNKQMYGSSQSFRAKMMKRRLSFMTAKMMQVQQIGYFLDMPVGFDRS